MSLARVNGTTLSYSRSGSGIPLLCLHGGMGLDSSSLRTEGIEGLSEQGFDVVVFDQRGHGKSPAGSPADLTHEVWTQDVVSLADHLGWEQFALMGHSYGGFIALEVARGWPKRLSHLILVSTSAGPLRPQFPVVTSIAELSVFFRERWPHFFFGQDKYWEVFERLSFSVEPFNAAFQIELPKYNLSAHLGELTVPTLLVVGDRDSYLPAMRLMAKSISGAVLNVLAETGHLPFVETAAGFQSSLVSFTGAAR